LLGRHVVVQEAAAPGPALAGRAEAGALGIREDVRADAAERVLVTDEPRAEALLEQMPDAAMATVEALRVHPVQAVHPVGEAFAQTLDHQVKVVVEQAKRVHPPVEPILGVDDPSNHRGAVVVIPHDVPPRDATNGGVERRVAREDGTCAARHQATVAAAASVVPERHESAQIRRFGVTRGAHPPRPYQTSPRDSPSDSARVDAAAPDTSP